MSKFVRVNCSRYTSKDGHYLWLNLDNIIFVDEERRFVQCVGQETNFYIINDESMPELLRALKGGAEK